MRSRAALASAVLMLVALSPMGGRADAPECDWPQYGHDVGHSFAASCTSIAPVGLHPASSLVPKWVFPLQSPVTAQPAVRWGMVMVGSADGTFYALPTDPPPGPVQPVWTFSVTDHNHNDYGAIVSSPATFIVNGTKVVVFGGGSTLYVLDASNGHELASLCFDPRPIATRCKGSDRTIEIESSPSIVQVQDRTLVTVGMDFNEDSGVGRAGMLGLMLRPNPWALVPLWKYDPERQVAYTSDPEHDGEPGFEYTTDIMTAGGAGQGCGNVWSSPAVDTDRNLVFFGTGNCDGRPMPAGEFGGEANYAVDLLSGKLAWRYSPRGNNDLDFDIGSSPNLLPNNLVGEGGKDGVYYAFHRTNDTASPQPVWKTKIAAGSSIGGMIASTATGFVTPIGTSSPVPAVFASTAIPLDPNSGLDSSVSSPGQLLALHAIDAHTGKVLWDAPVPFPAYGAPVYANGVVFLPDTFGSSVQAFDANTGLPLWVFPLNGAPASAPAVVGNSIYMGTGTAAGGVPAGSAAGIWAFHTIN